MATNRIPSRRERPKKKRRIWPWVLVILCFLGAAVAGAMFASSSLIDKNTADKVEEGLLTAKDKSTIMIMGVDEREDDVGRSDTLMIATVDPKRSRAALLSIPRDTRVKIAGHGWDKINAAYAYGGERLTQRTVEDFLGVNMDHYVIINTHAFQKIIDAIGGIDIDVEKRMYYEDPWDDDGGLVIDLRPGMQHMDGKTAVTYVRYRDEEGDIGRIKRQQKFMAACMEKITSPAIIPKLPAVIREVLGSVKTDLSMRQLLEFAGTLKEAQRNGLKTDMVPGRPLYIDGISYWIPEVEKLRTTLAETLGVTLSGSARANLERAAHEYENSIPANATEVPASDHSIGRATEGKSSSSTSSSDRKRKDSEKTSTSNGRTSERDTEDTTSTDRTTTGGTDARTSQTTDARSEDTQASQQKAASTDDAPTPGAGRSR
ncbi:MAG: LCP family protein [Selenomonas sp.]|uniref:LCP family protein n=1 Tax=Selenomonas sp. TaxID=2053611 RepID=UPI0025F4A1CC|nr:LCP family protein [Selenomonas sp.]MCI6086266.1 LCP family protein [Selenomonas sp.]